MPVVEPYAISEPFSTAGKVNMNYRMKPFSYIKRDTAVRSVLGSVKMTAIPEDALTSQISGTATYLGYSGKTPYPYTTRFNLNVNETLKQFDSRFDLGDGNGKPVFVSETEICNLDLVPDDGGNTTFDSGSLAAFWGNKKTTGDNSRERPYALLYPRLTTKSNTYTVYVMTQSLAAPAAYRSGWNEKAGSVTGEWRGEYTIERYIDPNDPSMPTLLDGSATSDDTDGDGDLSQRYKFRTLNMKRFEP
jgi:uncharacterized protein (TIGR02600 family)